MATAGAETPLRRVGRQFWGNGRAGSYRFQAFETAGPRTSVAWSLLISILAGMLTRPKSRQSEFVSS